MRLILGLAMLPVLAFGTMLVIREQERSTIEAALSPQDIAFGGDIDRQHATYKRLRALSAKSDDVRSGIANLSVAIVTLTDDRRVASPQKSWIQRPDHPRVQPIKIDLSGSGAGGVLLIADRPVLWAPMGAEAAARAKIGIEGAAVFDMAGATQGILAGFRIRAYGSHAVTSPADAERSARPAMHERFCNSMRIWIRNLGVEPGEVRLWRFTDPDGIAVGGDSLEQTGGTASKPEYLSEFCGGADAPRSRRSVTIRWSD